MTTPEMDQFAETTRRVMKGETYRDHIPTAYFPERCQLMALAEVPPNEDDRIRDICLSWARKHAQGEEPFLVACKETDTSFRVIYSRDGELLEHVYPAQVI
jgi:hypothetical protein